MRNVFPRHRRRPSNRKNGLVRPALPTEIETERLVIRPFCLSDKAALYELHCDDDVGRFTGGVRTREESNAILNKMISNLAVRGYGTMAITEKKNLVPVVGWCGVKPLENTDDIEIVYGLAKRFWGKGYATESARTMMARAFEALNVNRIVALVYPANYASIRVLEKLGMTYDKQVYYEPAASHASLYSVSVQGFSSQSSSK